MLKALAALVSAAGALWLAVRALRPKAVTPPEV